MSSKRGRKGLFEDMARLAWMLDAEQSYRSAGIREWNLVDLEIPKDDPKGPTLPLLLDKAGPTIPEVRLSPTVDGRVAIHVQERIAVRGIDDEEVRSPVESPPEVDYGTVVRVSPLLFAPLTQEQALTLENGSLELPFIEPSEMLEVEELSEPDHAEIGKNFSRRAPLLLALAAISILIGIAVIIMVLQRPSTDHLRTVAVVVDMDEEREMMGSRGSNIHHRISDALKQVELLPIALPRLGKQNSTETLTDRFGQAQKAHATHLIVIELEKILENRQGRDHFQRFVVAEVAITLLSKSDGEPTRYEAVFSTESSSAGDAIELILESTVDFFETRIVDDLYGSQEIDEFLKNYPRTKRGRRTAKLISKRRSQRDLSIAFESIDEVPTSTDDSEDVHCTEMSPHNNRVVGVLPEGSKAVVQVELGIPGLDIEVDTIDDDGRVHLPSRMDLIDLDSGQRTTIDWTHGYHGVSGMTEDGRTIAAGVDFGGNETALVTYDVENGKRTLVLGLEKGRIKSPRPSPSGKHIAYWHSAKDKTIKMALFHVLDLEKRHLHTPRARPFRFSRYDTIGWQTTQDWRTKSNVEILGLSQNTRAIRHDHYIGCFCQSNQITWWNFAPLSKSKNPFIPHEYTGFYFAPNSYVWTVESTDSERTDLITRRENDKCYRLDVKPRRKRAYVGFDREIKAIELEQCPDSQLSRRGDYLYGHTKIEKNENPELIRFDVNTGRMEQLTDNDIIETELHVARDAPLMVFERHFIGPKTGKLYTRVCWAKVPDPPGAETFDDAQGGNR